MIDCDGALQRADLSSWATTITAPMQLERRLDRRSATACRTRSSSRRYRPRRDERAPVPVPHLRSRRGRSPIVSTDKKPFDMIYVGHTKFAGAACSKVLQGDREGARPGRPRRPRRRGLGRGRRLDGTGRGQGQALRRPRLHEGASASRGCRPCPSTRSRRPSNKGVFNPGRLPAALRAARLRHLPHVRDAGRPAPSRCSCSNRDYVVEIFGERATELMIDGRGRTARRSSTCWRGPSTTPRSSWTSAEDFRVRHSPEARLRELIGYIEE